MEPFVEVKSALWQKIFASVVALPFVGLGLACWVSPFVPIFSGPAPHPALAFALGLILGGFFFCVCWWPVMRYSIRADRKGITQFNGFFRQSVRWSQVESYYLEQNSRFHSERYLYIEPVMLDAEGKIIFQGFAHILKSTKKTIEQRRALWRFVEAQLEGKRIEKPFTVLDAHDLAVRSFNNVNWAAKSWTWKTVRIMFLTGYAVFCAILALAPSYHVIVGDVQVSETTKLLLIVWMMMMFIAPLLVRAIQVTLKERRIVRELAARAIQNNQPS